MKKDQHSIFMKTYSQFSSPPLISIKSFRTSTRSLHILKVKLISMVFVSFGMFHENYLWGWISGWTISAKTCCIACPNFHFFSQKITHRGNFFKFFLFVLGSCNEFSFLFLILFIKFSFGTIKLVTYKNGIGNWVIIQSNVISLRKVII